MMHPDSYLAHLVAGRDPGDVEDWVDRWHTGDSKQELHEFLGMTWEEYGNWVVAPDALPHIVAIRTMVDKARLAITRAVAGHAGQIN